MATLHVRPSWSKTKARVVTRNTIIKNRRANRGQHDFASSQWGGYRPVKQKEVRNNTPKNRDRRGALTTITVLTRRSLDLRPDYLIRALSPFKMRAPRRPNQRDINASFHRSMYQIEWPSAAKKATGNRMG